MGGRGGGFFTLFFAINGTVKGSTLNAKGHKVSQPDTELAVPSDRERATQRPAGFWYDLHAGDLLSGSGWLMFSEDGVQGVFWSPLLVPCWCVAVGMCVCLWEGVCICF